MADFDPNDFEVNTSDFEVTPAAPGQWQRPRDEGLLGAAWQRVIRGGKRAADAIYPAVPAPPKSHWQALKDAAIGVGTGAMEVGSAITAPVAEAMRPVGEAIGRAQEQTPEQWQAELAAAEDSLARARAYGRDQGWINNAEAYVAHLKGEMAKSPEQRVYEKGETVGQSSELLAGAMFGKPFKFRGPIATEAPAAAFVPRSMRRPFDALTEVPPLKPGQEPIIDPSVTQPEPPPPPPRQVRPYEEPAQRVAPQVEPPPPPAVGDFVVTARAAERTPVQSNVIGQVDPLIPSRVIPEELGPAGGSRLVDPQGRRIRPTPEPGQGTARAVVSPDVPEPVAPPRPSTPLKSASQVAEERTGGVVRPVPETRPPATAADELRALDTEAESGIERALRQGVEAPEGPTQRLIREGRSIAGGSADEGYGFTDKGWIDDTGKNHPLDADTMHTQYLDEMGKDYNDAFNEGWVRYAKYSEGDGRFAVNVEVGNNPIAIQRAIQYIQQNSRGASGFVVDITPTTESAGISSSGVLSRPWQAIEFLKKHLPAEAAPPAPPVTPVTPTIAPARTVRGRKQPPPISGGSDMPVQYGPIDDGIKDFVTELRGQGFPTTHSGSGLAAEASHGQTTRPYVAFDYSKMGGNKLIDLEAIMKAKGWTEDTSFFGNGTERAWRGPKPRSMRLISGGSDAPIGTPDQPLPSAREIGMRRKPTETTEDLVTVYRGEGTEKAALPEWAKTNAGQWFTTSKSKAEGFAAERAGNVRELQVPRAYLKDYAVEGTVDEFLIPQVAQKNLETRAAGLQRTIKGPRRPTREPGEPDAAPPEAPAAPTAAPETPSRFIRPKGVAEGPKTVLSPEKVEAAIKAELPTEVRAAVGSKRTPPGGAPRWKERLRRMLPQEEFVNREAPNSPVVTDVAWYNAEQADRVHTLLKQPWMAKIRKMDPETIKQLEKQAVDAFEAGGRTPEAFEAAIKSWPEELKEYVRYRNQTLAEENLARKSMKLDPIDELPGPYLPHAVDTELNTAVNIESGTRGSSLQTTVKGAQEHRKARTMLDGEAAGIQYADPRNAILIREWNSIRMTQTERLMTSLRNRALFETEEAARAVSKTGDAIPVTGLPGADTYWAPSKAEALFLAQNIAQRPAGLQAPLIGNLKTYSDLLFRNPNLVNPAPHITKNMWAKYILASGDINPGRIVADGLELFRKPDLDTVKLFREYMPYADADPAYAQLQRALVKGTTETAAQTALDYLALLNKPSSHVIFKWGDPAMRYSLFKKYLKKGLTPQEAANHAWVDLVNYGTRSDLVDFWKAIPMNFFVPWRVGSVTSVGKQILNHPLRAAIVIGGVDMLREMRYRETGRWTHLPWDYFEGPLVTAVEAILKGNASELTYEVMANTMFGPAGEATAGNIRRMLEEPKDGQFTKNLAKVFWGLVQLFPSAEIATEFQQFTKDGDPSHFINSLMAALVAERQTKGFKPHRLGEVIPESVLPKSYKVKYNELTNPTNR